MPEKKSSPDPAFEHANDLVHHITIRTKILNLLDGKAWRMCESSGLCTGLKLKEPSALNHLSAKTVLPWSKKLSDLLSPNQNWFTQNHHQKLMFESISSRQEGNDG